VNLKFIRWLREKWGITRGNHVVIHVTLRHCCGWTSVV
jgi:hypothetical protein